MQTILVHLGLQHYDLVSNVNCGGKTLNEIGPQAYAIMCVSGLD